jgi:tetratricopeptide (TPR) repeat protein
MHESMSFNSLANIFDYLHAFDSSFFYYKKALEISLAINDKTQVAYGYQGIGEMLNKFGKNDSAIVYLNKAIPAFQSAGHFLGVSQTYIDLADVYLEQSKYAMAIEKVQQAIKISSELKIDHEVSNAYERLGTIYYNLGNYADAISNYEKAFALRQKINSVHGMDYILYNIGTVYLDWQKYDESLKYYLKSIEGEISIGNGDAIYEDYNNIGYVYLQKNDYKKAADFIQKALPLALKANDQTALAEIYQNLGNLELKKGNVEKALYYFKLKFDIDKLADNNAGQVAGLIYIARAYSKINKEKALKSYKDALELAETKGLKADKSEILKDLSELYLKTGDYQKSALTYNEYCKLSNEVFNDKATQQMAKFEVKYDVYKKSKEIEILQLNNKIKTSEINKQRILKFSFVIGFVVLGFFFITVYRQLKKLKNAHKELVKKNIELTRKDQALGSQFSNKPFKAIIEDLQLQSGKYSGSSISDEQIEILLKELKTLMFEKKAFLDPEITLTKLAKQLNTNSAYLSQIINDTYQQNFNNFINEYRVKEARVLLNDENYANYTIEGIAQNVGFNSKSAFNVAFKKFTGVTPSFYQKTIRENALV